MPNCTRLMVVYPALFFPASSSHFFFFFPSFFPLSFSFSLVLFPLTPPSLPPHLHPQSNTFPFLLFLPWFYLTPSHFCLLSMLFVLLSSSPSSSSSSSAPPQHSSHCPVNSWSPQTAILHSKTFSILIHLHIIIKKKNS